MLDSVSAYQYNERANGKTLESLLVGSVKQPLCH
jgi:hypothetical protein